MLEKDAEDQMYRLCEKGRSAAKSQKGEEHPTNNTKKGGCPELVLHRNCLPKHVLEGKIEGRIEVTGRRGRRRKKLLDNLTAKRGYCKLKEEALDCNLLRSQ